MFANLFKVAALSAMVAGVVATPLPKSQARAEQVVDIVARGSYSFDNWGGISSLSGFDNFYGSDNYRGDIKKQVIVEEDEKVVCRSESIEFVQQRLLVLQEIAKRIITEQICEVETQIIVFEQFRSSMSSFSHDISRHSGRSVGYDRSISGHYSGIMNSDGSLSNNDLGFNGQSLGLNTVVPTGNNWNNSTSPASVAAAFNATRAAISSSNSTTPSNSTSH